MLDWLRNLDWAPRSARKLRRDVDGAIARLRHELQREPTTAEIAGALDLTEPAYDQMLEQIRTAEVAVIRPLEFGAGDTSVMDVAIDPTKVPTCGSSARK
jgi:RNA polymerase sigma factor for flagellar operon FliA